jgi:phosphate transport system permease protein
MTVTADVARAADVPRRLDTGRGDDLALLAGSLVGSLALVSLLYTEVLPTSGKLGFVVVWFFVFLIGHGLLTGLANPRTVVYDRVATAAMTGAAAIAGTILVSTVAYTFIRGWRPMTHANFYLHDMNGVAPGAPLTHGGILHAIAGSLLEIGIAAGVTVPLGIGTAVYMTEVGGRFSQVVRTVVEAMTALPSVVAGLFIYTSVVVALGQGRCGLAASFAIGVMMLPIIARASDVVLRLVPSGLREAGLALGSPAWSTVWHVVLPSARSGLATAVILAVARGIGETSPVLLTSALSSYLTLNPLDLVNSLPLFIFNCVRSPTTLFVERGYGAAAVLLVVVLVLFAAARLVASGRIRLRRTRKS